MVGLLLTCKPGTNVGTPECCSAWKVQVTSGNTSSGGAAGGAVYPAACAEAQA